jgi:serine/threonine-protein kinase
VQATLSAERGPLVGRSFVVRPGAPFLVGSAEGVQVRVADVAPRQAALMLDAKGLTVVDLAGGTTLDGGPLPRRQPTPVGTGQAIGVGATLLRVELDGVPEPSRAPQGASAPAPVQLEGFQVLGKLGQGGMGVVLHARSLADGREVAVKVLAQEVVPGSPDHRRFLVEGRVGARIRSPHVVEVLELRVDARGHAMIVMELVRGPSLEGWLAKHGRLAVDAAARIGLHAALGLTAAHEAGVLHRDVKPANLLLAPEGVAKVTDFGVAKDLAWTLDSLTKSGVGLGTVAYMAPEQLASARSVDVTADVYGLGATLYHALAGRPPHVIQAMGDLPRVLQEEPPPLASLRPDCPPPLAALVHAMLAKDPWDRPAAMREVAERLRPTS